jgi:hypothetical protein
MGSTSEVWKQIPPALVYNLENVWASTHGNIKIDNKLIGKYKTSKGKYGYYPCTRINGTTTYFHRLVYFAHSNKTIEELQSGRVIFKNIDDGKPIIDENGMYRCWFEDLMFEQSKFNSAVLTYDITQKDAVHPTYGDFKYGAWIPLYTFNKKERTHVKSNVYEICLLDNADTPCIVRNKNRGTNVKYHFHNGHDGYLVLIHMGKPTSYLLSHIMLASTFPDIQILQTADHINDNSKNHNIVNLQWLSYSDNAKKGQEAQPKVRVKEEAGEIEGEVWKPLPINSTTLENYSVSNRGRVKRNKLNSITIGNQLRGKKYSYCCITTAANTHTKYYIHQLVYITFHGILPEGYIILHDDMAPLTSDGRYRNWSEDLRAGDKRENGNEHHAAKRMPIF